jgi:hypothetical protein
LAERRVLAGWELLRWPGTLLVSGICCFEEPLEGAGHLPGQVSQAARGLELKRAVFVRCASTPS